MQFIMSLIVCKLSLFLKIIYFDTYLLIKSISSNLAISNESNNSYF